MSCRAALRLLDRSGRIRSIYRPKYETRRSPMNPKVDAFLKRQHKWRAEFEKLADAVR